MAGERILVVEDETQVSDLIQRYLEKAGYSVVACLATGDAAVQEAERLRPDLALMDIHLPGKLDGVAAAEWLHERLSIPVVFLTGMADDATLLRSRGAEAFGYVLKPFGPEDLKASIELALNKNTVENELRRFEHWFSAAIKSIADAVMTTDASGLITFLNPVAEALTGWPGREALARKLDEVFQVLDEQELATIENPIPRVIAEDRVISLPARVALRARNKGKIPVEGRVAPIKNDQQAIIGAVLVFRDISERKRAEFRSAQFAQLGHRLNSAATPREAAQIIVEIAGNLFGWDACRLDQYSPAEDRMQALLTVDLINGRRADAPSDQSVRELTLFERLIIEQGGQLILQQGEGRAAAGYFPFGDASQPSASLMFVPIRSGNSVIGVFSIQSYKENAYSKEDLTALQSLADHCSGAFERIRSRERLRSLAAHLQSVREEERTRMAREIHDEFGQMLTGFKMDLSWLDKRLGETKTKVGRPALAEKVKSMSGLVDEMVRSVRRIAAELRPGVLDDLGLVAAIEWQVREFQKRTGIGCKLNTALDNVALPPELSTAVFRILQETLTNVARHAQASHLTVSLAANAKLLVLEVQDNGRGITEVERIHSKSFGLVGMRERAMILGGDFDIRGANGKGTTVTVSIPLDHPADV